MGLLARLHGPVRSVGEVERGCLYASRHSRGCRYIYVRTSRARNQAFERPEQIFGASPLKTRDEPTDELICFPTLPAFLAFFFRLSARHPLPVFRPSPPSLTPRCLHSREYSSIYLKMTPITQVKYTRALIYCLSIYKPFSQSPDLSLYIHAPPRSYSLWLF